MKYSVLKQLANERKLGTNDEPTTVSHNDVQEIGLSRRYNEKKTRRYRSAFTTDQINYLEKQFQKFPYIESDSRKAVASILNIPERTVKFWFQNRRMKEKKESFSRENVAEEQNKINGSLKDTIDTKIFDQQSHCTSGNISYKLKPILVYPDITNNSSSNNMKSPKVFSKAINEKQRIAVRNLDSMKMIGTNLMRPQPDHINKPTNMNLLHKNVCEPKLPTREMPVKQNLKNIRVKERNPMEYKLKSPSNSRVCQPYYYQIHPNDQSYVPFHVKPLIQHPSVPGNIIWKPINTLSVLPSMVPPQMMAYNNRFLQLNQNIPREQCKCNCKIENTHETSSSYSVPTVPPKYILTMPFSNNFE